MLSAREAASSLYGAYRLARRGVMLVPDDRAAAAAARRYLRHVAGDPVAGGHADQRMLRHLVPENRLRAYDVRRVVDTLSDTCSVVELRGGFGVGMVTALARLDGRAVGVIANDPEHLGGAIDGDAARVLNRAARTVFGTDDRILPPVKALSDPVADRLHHEGRQWRIDRVAAPGGTTVAALIDVEREEHAQHACFQ